MGNEDIQYIFNRAAPHIPYYTPAQTPPAGTPKDDTRLPKVFTALKIRGVQFQNRIFVSVMILFPNLEPMIMAGFTNVSVFSSGWSSH